MFRSFLFLLVILTMFSAHAQSFNANSFLNDVVESFNNQDCLRYSSHFIKSIQSKKRREYGLFFAMNDSKMSLKESHIIFENDQKIEIFVSYSIDNNEFVSKILLDNEDGEWKINKEYMVKRPQVDAQLNVQTPQYASNPFKTGQTQNCSSGSCSTPRIPFGSLNSCRDYGFEPIPCRGGSCGVR